MLNDLNRTKVEFYFTIPKYPITSLEGIIYVISTKNVKYEDGAENKIMVFNQCK